MPDQHTRSPAHGDVLTAISDGLVALLKEFYGRGPTQAKTYYHDDLVVCVLRGGFTRVEQTLLAVSKVRHLQFGEMTDPQKLQYAFPFAPDIRPVHRIGEQPFRQPPPLHDCDGDVLRDGQAGEQPRDLERSHQPRADPAWYR